MPETVFPPPLSVPVSIPVEEVVVSPPPAKKFPKWLLLLFLVLILVFGLIFLLSGKKSTKVSGEIVWWGLWEEQATISPLITEYQTKNPKVKIKYLKQSQEDYRERLANALAKGTGPDIFTFHNSWTPMFKSDLSPLPATVISPADYSQSFFPVAADSLSYGDSILGIPLGYDALVLFINNDLFAATGRKPPVTWDDLRILAIELTKKDDRGMITQAGVALGRTENVDHWPEILALMMLQNGVNLSKPTGKLAADALTFFTLFSTNDAVWDATLPPSTSMFAGGKLAMYLAPSWRVFEIVQMNPTLNFKAVPVPQLPKNSAGQKDITYATFWAQGVANKSKNKDVAWDFLKYLSSKDALSKIYANAAKIRKFGQAYARTDMTGLLSDHPVLGAIVGQGASAKSWYLQSRTFDGPTGINSLTNKYFEDAVNAVNAGTAAETALETVAQGVAQILRQYGITK